MRLYKITVENKSLNPDGLACYVYAESADDAKRRFVDTFAWRDINGVAELTEDETAYVREDANLNPAGYLII